MDRPTYNEARPLWRRDGDVPTHQSTMSAAERAARARQAGAPASQPPLTLQTARRLRAQEDRSMAPVQREHEGADCHTAATSPRPAPPPPKPVDKPARKSGTVARKASTPKQARPAPSDEAEKINTPPDTHTNLARLVAQLRDERDALQSENTALRARIQAVQAALQEA